MIKDYKPYYDITPHDIAEKMHALCGIVQDESKKAKEIEELENAIYQIKATAQNSYNFDYWRTFWACLQMITEE